MGRCRWSPNSDEPLLFIRYDWRQLNILDAEKNAFTLKSPIQMEFRNIVGSVSMCIEDLFTSTWFHLSRYQFLNILPKNELLIPLLFFILLRLVWFTYLTCRVTNSIDVCQSNGNLLAAGGWDQNLKYLTKEKQRLSRFLRFPAKVLCFISLIALFLRSILGFLDEINCIRWSPSGDMIASGSTDETVALLDFKTGKKLYHEKTSTERSFLLLEVNTKSCYVCRLHLSTNQIRWIRWNYVEDN